ncbi:MAG TPA: hypothetical protein VK612_05075 [Pyrinomonadaceae bacterium]|nr:hypothetical protein [Pyrinomonadaceae bacterium]
METIKKEKTFDAVKMMRDIRDKISSETQNMTFVEFKEYIRNNLKENKANPTALPSKKRHQTRRNNERPGQY